MINFSEKNDSVSYVISYNIPIKYIKHNYEKLNYLSLYKKSIIYN